MFITTTRQRIVLLRLRGTIIRTTANHPFFVQDKGWTEAAHLRPGDPLLAHDGQHVAVEGISDSGEQETVYQLHLGEQTMPDQPRPNYPVLGFVAGTPILTPEGYKRIEELRPGDLIQTQPDDHQGDQEPEVHEDGHRWWENN